MNNRIRELIEQATTIEVIHGRGFDTTQYTNHFDKEKFAELIINECLTLCENVAVHADKTAKGAFVTDSGRMLHEGMWGGAKNCSGQIKQHFGVEE